MQTVILQTHYSCFSRIYIPITLTALMNYEWNMDAEQPTRQYPNEIATFFHSSCNVINVAFITSKDGDNKCGMQGITLEDNKMQYSSK